MEINEYGECIISFNQPVLTTDNVGFFKSAELILVSVSGIPSYSWEVSSFTESELIISLDFGDQEVSTRLTVEVRVMDVRAITSTEGAWLRNKKFVGTITEVQTAGTISSSAATKVGEATV